MSGKGDRDRTKNHAAYRKSMDRIFRRKDPRAKDIEGDSVELEFKYQKGKK